MYTTHNTNALYRVRGEDPPTKNGAAFHTSRRVLVVALSRCSYLHSGAPVLLRSTRARDVVTSPVGPTAPIERRVVTVLGICVGAIIDWLLSKSSW